jgi:hypothetical protein
LVEGASAAPGERFSRGALGVLDITARGRR